MIRSAASVFAAGLILVQVSLLEGAPQASPPPTDVAPLAPGAPIERMLEGSERHAYDLQLRAGEYAGLTVEQRGVDVIVRILDASGALVAAFDEEARKERRERVRFVADASTTYRLLVLARYPKHDPGRYAIWIDEIRAAQDPDRALYDARKLATEAASLRSAGKFDDAIARVTRALALAESSLGPNDPYVGLLVTSIGVLQRAKGQEREAELTYQRAIAICENALGREHPQTASAIEALGILYTVMDEFAKAEPLLLESTAITERTLGEHPRVTIALRNLALFHTNRGDHTRAQQELQRALQIADRTMTPDDFDAIATVNNLGDLYITLKDFDRAQPLVERALRDLERTLGADNFRVTTPLTNLAVIARERGDFVRALEHLKRAYDIREKTYGKEHTQTASVLISIGNVYRAQGDYASALDTYQRALTVLERTAGPYHNLTVMTLNNMARAYSAAGNVASALEYQTRVDTLLDKTLAFNLSIGSEREKLAFLESTFERMGRAISLHLRQAPSSMQAADLAALAILRRKGRVLDSLSVSHATLRARLDPGDQALLDELTKISTDLSTLALSGPGRTPFAEYMKKLTALEEQRATLESRISSRSTEFRAESQAVALPSLRAALPPDSALIEFAVYQPFDTKAVTDKDAYGEPRYAAYVIRHAGDTRGIDLGPATVVDAAVARLRQALRDPRRRDVSKLARAVDELVFAPVRALAADATRLLIAPDGALNLLPFAALVDERGAFQVERYAVSYLGSGRDLLRMQVASPASGPPLVLANPAFGEPSPAPEQSVRARGVATTNEDEPIYFAPLAGTSQEALAIGRMLPGALVLTGERATKRALTRATAPSILHVASHAFFLPGDSTAQQQPVAGTRAMTAKVQSPNPLLRSGIALAGANRASRDGDAGVLTALEASTLNLWGTKLVTLSACDTGVGDVRNGEGVFGLRRAFFLAGAETVVMSLWPVSDYMTRAVMTKYYAALTRGLGRGAALRQVQREMLTDKQRRHPFYWAGFIQAGDWRPLKEGTASKVEQR